MPKQKRGDITSTPHDALIKYTFSQREHAAGLLRAALSPEIVAIIRWSTLELEKIHFVDRGLRGRYADLLFSAEMGDERVYVYVLLEHQSKVERLMIFRMGSYMWRQWDQLVRDDPARENLPAIIPILIHHSDTGWTAATSFGDIIAAPAVLRPHIPQFQMKLVDVSRDPSSGLVKQALTDLGRVVLWCLSVAGDNARFTREIDQLVAELNALYAAPNGLDALLAVVRYLVATHPPLGAHKIGNLVKKTAWKGQKEIEMDRFDAWIEELKREGREVGEREGREAGERKGREAGEREGRARMLLEQLGARFGAVPAKVRARVVAADEAMLSRWSIRLLTAPTLAAVLDEAAPAKKRAVTGKKAAATKRASARKQMSA